MSDDDIKPHPNYPFTDQSVSYQGRKASTALKDTAEEAAGKILLYLAKSGLLNMTDAGNKSATPFVTAHILDGLNAADWLIWSNEHRAWWKAGGWGYTQIIGEAGRFSKARADQVCEGANFREINEVAVLAP